MNDPKKLNGWSGKMMEGLLKTLRDTAKCEKTKVVILTGKDPYYCAGVQLNALMRPMHPRKLLKLFEEKNRELFDAFIEFPKPIIAAVNGPAIGASVTSASLCDAIIASERATFHTPFAALRIPPEGCSSVHFEKIMGKENAQKMLKEGWKPTGADAEKIGLALKAVPHDQLLPYAQSVAEQWIKEGKTRWLVRDGAVDEYKRVNQRESKQVAESFLSYGFLENQYNFLQSKGKRKEAFAFWLLMSLRPIWARFL